MAVPRIFEAMTLVSNRKRHYHWMWGGEPSHGHFVEYIYQILSIISCVIFVVGSFCFLPGFPAYVIKTGDMLFIIGSIIYMVMSFHTLLEIRSTVKQKGEMDAYSRGEIFCEWFEQILYFVAAVIFTIGTVLFWPGIPWANEDSAKYGEFVATWFFIVGSYGFVLATFCNSIAMTERGNRTAVPGKVGIVCHWMMVWELFLSLFGGILFVIGSYLYRPGFRNDCSQYRLIEDEETSHGTAHEEVNDYCVSVLKSGTYMYIIGSFLYTFQAITCFVRCIIRHHFIPKDDGWFLKEGDSSSNDEREGNGH